MRLKNITLSSIGLFLVACSAAPSDPASGTAAPESVDTTSSAYSGSAQLPQGLVCGLSYYFPGRADTVKGCDNLGPWSSPVDFSLSSDGDLGAPNGYGYYHQTLRYNHGQNAQVPGGWSDPASLPLPVGTACGFKETKNDTGETCLGFDPAHVADGWHAWGCPDGFTREEAYDFGSDGGHWVWCSYNDYRGNCSGGSVDCDQNIPQGTACGIYSTHDRMQPWQGSQCKGTNRVGQCPDGYTPRHGGDDEGSAAAGLSWCEKD